MRGFDAQVSVHDFGGDIVKAGFLFVGRYYTGSPAKTALSRDEAAHLGDMGISILPIFEHGYPTSAPYFSYQRGLDDARFCLDAAASNGHPDGKPVFFAVDYDAAPGHIPGIAEYFKALRDRLMPKIPPAVYGSGRVCRLLWDAGLVRATWLAQSTGWAEYHDWWPKAQVLQQGRETNWNGIEVDFDICLDASVVWRLG